MKNTIKDDHIKSLKIMITILPRGKKEIFVDLLEKYKVNVQMNFFGKGTATTEILTYLGLDSLDKDVLISIIREDMVDDCLLELEDKMNTFKNYNGVAFSIPLESIIGTNNYLLLANLGRSNSLGQ